MKLTARQGILTSSLVLRGQHKVRHFSCSDAKVFFSFPDLHEDEKRPMRHIIWMFNHRTSQDDCQWRGCEVQPLVPCRVPEALRGHVSLLEQRGLMESLPRHAIRTGIYLDSAPLIRFARANKIPTPSVGSGSINGKTGKAGVVKIDWAKDVVEHFAADLSPERKQFLVDRLMGKKQANKFACPKTILDSIESLDLDNKNMPMFRQVKRMAEEQSKADANLPRGLFMGHV